jgi:hypothetical protein
MIAFRLPRAMSPSDTRLVTLRVLGTPDVRSADGNRVTSVLAQPKRLGLLTYLALAPAPVSRATLVAVFWPDSDETRARNALSQAVFHLRRSLGDEVVQSSESDRLWAPPEQIWCDAREALTNDIDPLGNWTADGELLEGWNADDSHPLQEWLDRQRSRLRERLPPRARATPVLREGASEPLPAIAAAVHAAEHRKPHGARRIAVRPPISGRVPVALAAVAFLAVVGVLLVGVAYAASRFAEPAADDLVVLMPRVLSATGVVPVSPPTVLDEVLAHLPADPLLRVVPTPTATSVPELRRQLAALGIAIEDTPDWILDVSVRMTHSEVRTIALLYRSPAMDVPGRKSFGVEYAGEEKALVDLPREIAGPVAAMVDSVLAELAASRR